MLDMQSPFPVSTLLVGNMVCSCCCRVLREELQNIGIEVLSVKLGRAEVSYDITKISLENIRERLTQNGFELITDKDKALVEQIKIAVTELIHYYNNANSLIRNSDYLVEKLGYSYPHLSKLFSQHEGQTLEKYIILQKTEKIKSLLNENSYSLSEIAYMMGYSSVQYLSNQFRKVTGLTMSEYKTLGSSERKALSEL